MLSAFYLGLASRRNGTKVWRVTSGDGLEFTLLQIAKERRGRGSIGQTDNEIRNFSEAIEYRPKNPVSAFFWAHLAVAARGAMPVSLSSGGDELGTRNGFSPYNKGECSDGGRLSTLARSSEERTAFDQHADGRLASIWSFDFLRATFVA